MAWKNSHVLKNQVQELNIPVQHNPNRYLFNLALFVVNVAVMLWAYKNQNWPAMYLNMFVAIFNALAALLNFCLRSFIKERKRETVIETTLGID